MLELNSMPLGNREAKKLLTLILVFVPLLGVGLFFPVLVVPFALCIPIVLLVAIALVVNLAQIGSAPVPSLPATAGVAFIAGGTAFDMAATAFHSPSLDAEGNPVARAFLDAGYTVSFVYVFGILAQGMFVIFLCIAWLAFLKHRQQLVTSIGCPATIHDLFRAAMGAGHLPKRRWWSLTFRFSELPYSYHVFWFIAVLLVAGSLDSWYLGLEWFNAVRSIRWIVVTIAIAAGMVCYFMWLWHASREKNNGIEQSVQPEPRAARY